MGDGGGLGSATNVHKSKPLRREQCDGQACMHSPEGSWEGSRDIETKRQMFLEPAA